MSRDYSAVLFDLGGTLWDAFGPKGREQVTREAVAAAGKALLGETAASEQVEKLVLGVLSRLGALRAARDQAAKESFASPVFREDDLEEVLAEAAAPFGIPSSREVVLRFGDDLTKHDRPYPETLAVLKSIRSARPGVSIGIVSNTVVQGEVIDRYLREQGILELLDFRVLSSELGWRKPHPAIYAAALAKAGARPQDALFVGDRPVEDVMGPARLGMDSVLVVQKGQPPVLPAGCNPLAVVAGLEAVLPYLSIAPFSLSPRSVM